MTSKENVYDQTYQYYLEQIRGIAFEGVALNLGAVVKANRLIVPFMAKEYVISAEGITGPSGERPRHDICVILSKYVLMCPSVVPREQNWVSFRDFKDSKPLGGYFANSVEGAIASFFSGRTDILREAGKHLGGFLPDLDVLYDFTVQFDVLPKIPVVLLFNDADEDFPAKCSLLFAARTEQYLDAECIAMVGSQLFSQLKRISDKA